MKSQHPDRERFFKEITNRIENEFPGSIVVWTGSGTPDEDFTNTNTEILEAFGIPEGGYERFEETVWELEKSVARPNGFSIMVFEFTPSEVELYRQTEYDAELKKRQKWSTMQTEATSSTQTGVSYYIDSSPNSVRTEKPVVLYPKSEKSPYQGQDNTYRGCSTISNTVWANAA